MKKQPERQTKLIIHHVGGRAGSISFPCPEAFEEDIVSILYEADESCVEQIKGIWSTRRCQTQVLPFCLLDKVGTSPFHLNYDPYTSSIYPFNEKYGGYYAPYKNSGMDYVFGDALKTMQTIEINTTTFDTIVANGDVLAPDFLSIDTQGSELDILRGAEQCLKQNILAVLVEVEFLPIYKGQPLFGDICAYLNQFGFELADTTFGKRYPMRGKQGLRGEGFITDGEALFLKSTDFLQSATKEKLALELNKLAFIALIFNRFEYMQLCLEHPGFQSMDKKEKYLFFMMEMKIALDEMSIRNFPIFSERYTYEESKARFAHAPSVNKGRLFKNLRKSRFFKLLKGIRNLGCQIKHGSINGWTNLYINGCIKMQIGQTRVEQLFKKYHLEDQYQLAARNRIHDSLIQKRSVTSTVS